MKEIKYICRFCGKTNSINSFWKWMRTPHYGSLKFLECEHCKSIKHFMRRQNWDKPWWFDWYK